MKNLFLIISCFLLTWTAQAQDVIVLNSSTTTVKDANISSLKPTQDFGTTDIRFGVYNWTNNGVHNKVRGLLDFDMSILPQNIEILDAKLILYHASFPQHNVTEHYGENEFYIERVTESWTEKVNWNNQPSTTTQNRAYAPTSSSNTQNYVIDVKNLVQDMVDDSDNSFGFMLKHVTEVPYRNNIFASSNHPDISLHQELIITYNVITSTSDANASSAISIYPNPTDAYIHFQSTDDISQVIVRDLLGRRINEINGFGLKNIEIREKGTFLLEIIAKGKHYFKKVVVE